MNDELSPEQIKFAQWEQDRCFCCGKQPHLPDGSLCYFCIKNQEEEVRWLEDAHEEYGDSPFLHVDELTKDDQVAHYQSLFEERDYSEFYEPKGKEQDNEIG